MPEQMLDILDSEILAMDQGPVKWALAQQHRSADLESFRKEAIDRFAEVGFVVNVLCYETNESGVFAFDFEIIGRTEPRKPFDFDKMVHEVTNNLLDEPGVDKGFIKSPTGAEKAAAQNKHKC